MRPKLLSLLVFTLVVPALAGQWDPNYVWNAGQTLYQGDQYTRIVDWGEPMYLESIYRESSGVFGSPRAPDRWGRNDSQYGGMLDYTGPTGGKVKWRFDHSPEGIRVPPDGHTPDYSSGVASSVALGMRICSGSEFAEYTQGNVSSFAANDGFPRLVAGGGTGKMELRWYNTPQTVGGIQSNWKPDTATVLGVSGNWLMPANVWAGVQLIFDNNAEKTWRAYLVRDGYPEGYMYGTYSGSPSSSLQFGLTSTTYNAGVVYDYLAFGWGAENIGHVPEPSTLGLLAMAVVPLLRRRAVR